MIIVIGREPLPIHLFEHIHVAMPLDTSKYTYIENR